MQIKLTSAIWSEVRAASRAVIRQLGLKEIKQNEIEGKAKKGGKKYFKCELVSMNSRFLN